MWWRREKRVQHDNQLHLAADDGDEDVAAETSKAFQYANTSSRDGHDEESGAHHLFGDVDGTPAGSTVSTYSFAKSNYPVGAERAPRISSSSPKVYALPADTLKHQVLRLEPNGRTRRFYVRRRDLLREHKLQPRDLRRIDPAIDFTKTSPSITVKENALLLCLGGVR
jgi:hypothetical protein